MSAGRSVSLALLSPTWSMPNNVLDIFGLDLTLNLWGSTVVGIGELLGKIGGADPIGESNSFLRFFDVEPMAASSRVGTVGIRRDGFYNELQRFMNGGERGDYRAFTFQHTVWAPSRDFEVLEAAFSIVPAAAFTPSLMGSVLLAKRGDQRLVLRGDSRLPSISGLQSWSRAGGPASECVPGSRVPVFPAGGLHIAAPTGLTTGNKPFTKPRFRVGASGDAGTLSELFPAGRVMVGVAGSRPVLRLPGVVAGLTQGRPFQLMAADGTLSVVDLLSVEEGTADTTIVVSSMPASAGPYQLRGLDGPSVTATLSAVAGSARQLDVAGAPAVAWQVGDVLRLRRTLGAPPAPTDVGAAEIAAREAALTLDAALPAGFPVPAAVRLGAPAGAERSVLVGAAPTTVTSPTAAALPPIGTLVVVLTAGGQFPAFVSAGAAADSRQLDRPIGGVAAGDTVRWRTLVAGAQLGVAAVIADASTTLTYGPDEAGRAPASGIVVVEGTGLRSARLVTARALDALVTTADLPDPTGGPYEASRHRPALPDVAGVTASTSTLLPTTPPLATAAPTAELLAVSRFAIPLAGATTGDQLVALLRAGAGAAITTGTVTGADIAPVPAVTAAAPTGLRPGAVVLLSRGADPAELAVVRTVQQTVRFRQDLPDLAAAAAAGTLQAAPVNAVGPAYAAVVLDPTHVTVRPQVTTPAGPTRTPLPRFHAGELVELTVVVGAATTLHRASVTEVDGTTLTITGHAPLPSPVPAAATITVRRLAPSASGAGGARVGIAGGVDAAGGARAFRFTVWSPNDELAVDNVLAVTDGTTTRPAVVEGFRSWKVSFAEAPARATGAAVEVRLLPAVSGNHLVTAFHEQGGALVVDEVDTAIPDGELVVIRGFAPTVGGTPTDVRWHRAGVLVPDEEGAEIDSRQALVDHELMHTRQCSYWGPFLLCMFPIGVIDGTIEALHGLDLPAFGPYAAGTIELDGEGRFLVVPGGGFAVGDKVQLAASGLPLAEAALGATDPAGRFRLSGSPAPPGAVGVRKRLGNQTAFEDITFLRVLRLLTHGGITNLLVGNTTGRIVDLFTGLFRSKGDTPTFEATVEAERSALRLADDAGRQALGTASSVIVQQQAGAVPHARAVTAADGVLRLGTPLPFDGTVRVSPAASIVPGRRSDGRVWRAATVEDPTRPSRLTLTAGGAIGAEVGDGLLVESGSVVRRSEITALPGGSVVEIEDAVLTDPTLGREVRVSVVGRRDPVRAAASDATLEQIRWESFRWVSDFWSQLGYELRPERGGFADVVLRIARILFGTHSFSLLMPGYFFWDNLMTQIPKDGHLSRMEQGASENSGDLYSSMGRLWDPPTLVGDVGRYRYHDGERTSTTIATTQLDRPGVHLSSSQTPRVIPFAQVRTAGSTLNGTSAPIAAEPADVAQPARPTSGAVWDLVEVDSADVRQGTGGGLLDVPDLARLPTSTTLGRSNGVYVAFSRPSTAAEPHRVTMPDGVPDGADMREAQDKKRQQSFFDLAVGDVTVSVAGVAVANGGTVTLRATQRAEVVVAQTDGGRVYDVGTTRDKGGARVRRRDEGTLVTVAAHAAAEPPEPVEVSRVYRVDAATGLYASGGLAGRTMHLAKDFHVPVRSFSVRVVTALDIRSAAVVDPAAPDANVVNGPDPANPAVALVPGLAMAGELFLFVPAAVVSGPEFAPANIAGAPVATVLAVTGVPAADLDEPTRRAAGDGAVFRLSRAGVVTAAVEVEVSFRTWLPDPNDPSVTPTSPGAVLARLTARLRLDV